MLEAAFISLLFVAAFSLWPPIVVFSIIAVSHDLLFGQVDGLLYYLSAGAFDALCISLLTMYRPTYHLKSLQTISLISLIVNGFGWAIYELNYEPLLYNQAMIVIYILAIAVTLWRLKDGVPRNRSGGIGFFCSDGSGYRGYGES